jgi:glycosyltransferase involved in cell wall biosynthesis
VFKELTQLTLHIYGTGPEENKVKKAFSCCKNILFYDPIPNDKLCEVISCYRFGLLLSKYEGMPKVAIEMMSMGLVLIATPVGNLNQILVHQENSIIAPNDSSKWKELLINAKSLSEIHLTNISKKAHSNAMKYHTSNIISREIKIW